MKREISMEEFFNFIENEHYVIIKYNGNINFSFGEDLDIFCYDINQIINQIIKSFRAYIEECDYKFKVSYLTPSHVHFDIVDNKNKIIFRFDLYSDLPKFKKLNIKKSFFSFVIENRVKKEINVHDRKINIYIPDEISDYIIRYFEYIEYYSLRPDKIKHLKFILEKFEGNDEIKEEFFKKIHYFTEFPRIDDEEFEKSKFFAFNKILYYLKKIKNTEKKVLIKKIMRKIAKY